MNGEKQVSFRLDEEVAKEMKAAAATNEVTGELGPFCRKLAEWAFRSLPRGGVHGPAQRFHGELPETEKTAIGGTVGVVHVDRQGYVARLVAVRVRHYGVALLRPVP